MSGLRFESRPGSSGELGGTGDVAKKAKQPLRSITVLAMALVVLVGGLVTWGAFVGWHSQVPQTFYPVNGQPYNVSPVRPVVPANTPTANGVTTASQRAVQVTTVPQVDITLKVNPPPLGGLYGPDGQIQDAFIPAYFAVPAGKKIHVTVLSYDGGWHTFSSPKLGVSVWVRPTSTPTGNKPSKTTFTFTAPKAGYYNWLCELPCNPYSMKAGGYMEGEIHVVS